MFYTIAEIMLFMFAVIGWFNAQYKYEREKEKRFKSYYRGYQKGLNDGRRERGINE